LIDAAADIGKSMIKGHGLGNAVPSAGVETKMDG
jgi:hypothetical protein